MRTFALVALLTLLGLLLRIDAAYHYNRNTSTDIDKRFVGDERGYEGLGYGLWQGRGITWQGRTPGYPMFIAAAYSLLEERSPTKLLYVQACAGALVIPLTFLLARRLIGDRAALIAACILIFDVPLTEQATRVYSEVLFTPLLLAALALFVAAAHKPRATRFLIAGAAMSFAVLTRPSVVLLPIILAMFVPWRIALFHRARLMGVYALGIALYVGPWTLYNWFTYQRFMPLASSTAVLYQGSPECYRVYQQGHNVSYLFANQLNPEKNGGHDPFSIDGDRWFRQRAIESIKAEPLVYARFSLMKAAYAWLGNPTADWTYAQLFDWRTLKQWYSPLQIAGMIYARQLPLVALLGVVALALRRQWRAVALPVAVCAYFTVIHGLTSAETRYTEPLHPLLALIIASACGSFAAAASTRPDCGHR